MDAHPSTTTALAEPLPPPVAPAWDAPPQIRAPEKRAALAAFILRGNVSAACIAAGIGRRTWYDWRHGDPDFDAAVLDAEEAVADYLEQVAIARATAGPEPSDTLLIFLLKGLRPAKYRERYQLEHTGPHGGPVQMEVVTGIRDRLRDRLAHLLDHN